MISLNFDRIVLSKFYSSFEFPFKPYPLSMFANDSLDFENDEITKHLLHMNSNILVYLVACIHVMNACRF